MFKKSLFLISCVLSGNSAFATGIPVVDVGSITQAVLTLQQLKNEYEVITNQYNQAMRTYQNFTGNRGLGLIHYDTNLRSLLPAEARSTLRTVMRLGKSGLSGEALKIFNEGGFENACNGLRRNQRQYCINQQAGRAQYQAYLRESANVASRRLQNIESLMGQINQATDAKAIADLSARISVEKAALEATKLNASLQLMELEKMQDQLEDMERQKQHSHVFSRMTKAELAASLGM